MGHVNRIAPLPDPTSMWFNPDLKVYDTQTGAKLFRNSEWTKPLFERPFLTTWIFDVEILARFVTDSRYIDRPTDASPEQDLIVELPLREWIDRAGSKVEPINFVISFFEMIKLFRHYFGRHRPND